MPGNLIPDRKTRGMRSLRFGSYLGSYLAFIRYFSVNLYFRLVILFTNFQQVKSFINQTSGEAAPKSTAKWIGREVFRTARFVPGATCLSRGMTAQFVLKRQGYASKMCIGVVNSDKGFLAHAWVMSGDTVVVGNEDGELERFQLLTEIGNKGS